jgi:hypothetical protein
LIYLNKSIYFNLYTYHRFAKKLGIETSHQNSIIEKSKGYQLLVDNFRLLMKELHVEEKDFVKGMFSFNKNLSGKSPRSEIAERLLNNSKMKILNREVVREKVENLLLMLRSENLEDDFTKTFNLN